MKKLKKKICDLLDNYRIEFEDRFLESAIVQLVPMCDTVGLEIKGEENDDPLEWDLNDLLPKDKVIRKDVINRLRVFCDDTERLDNLPK